MTIAQTSSFSELLSTLLRRRWTILLTAMVGVGIVLGISMMLPPRYAAKAQLVVKPQQQGLLAGQQAVIAQSPDEPTVLTEITAITSYDQLQRVLASLKRDPQLGHIVAPQQDAAHEQDFLAYLRIWLKDHLLVNRTSGWLTMRMLQRNLMVFQEAGSHVIGVSFVSGSPTDSAAIANRVVQLYVSHQQEEKRAATDRALAWVDNRLKALQNESEATESKLREYQSSHQLMDTSQSGAMDQRFVDLDRELASAEADYAARSERLKNIESVRQSGASIEALAATLNTSAIDDFRRRLLDLMQLKVKLVSTYHKDDPSIELADRQIQEVRRLIGVEVTGQIKSYISDARAVAARVESLRTKLDLVQRSSSDSSVRALEREQTLDRALYLNLAQREEELHQQREGLTPNVDILSLAAPPDRPTSPGPVLFVPPALLAFTILGCFIAVLRERLDSTFHGESEITPELGLRSIGMIPRLRPPAGMRHHEYLLSNPFSPYAEAIRSVMAATHLRLADQSSKAILITSSLPGEGKTTLAVSLAAYTAKLGYRVLLMDLDLRNPGILGALGGKDQNIPPLPQKGAQEEALSERGIHHLPGLNLDYFAIRQSRSADPVALFARPDIANFLCRLRHRYDYILIDSAPLLAVTEARLLAALADRILFVVKWGSTRRDEAWSAIDILRNAGDLNRDFAALVSVVINQVDPKSRMSHYYHYVHHAPESIPTPAQLSQKSQT